MLIVKIEQPQRFLKTASALGRSLTEVRFIGWGLAGPVRSVGLSPGFLQLELFLHGHIQETVMLLTVVQCWDLCCRWYIWVSDVVSRGSGELPSHPDSLPRVDAGLMSPLTLKNRCPYVPPGDSP